MASKRKNIVISNIVTLNPGDGAILEGMVLLLKKKYGDNANITVFDNKAKSAKKYFPQYHFRQSMFYGISDKTFPGNWLKRYGYGHWSIRLRYVATRTVLLLLSLRLAAIAKLFFGKELVESVTVYSAADIILSTGGTYLIENYDLTPAINDYRFSMACKKPLVFFTQTLGPFTKPRIVKAFQSIFAYATKILVRDDKSVQHLTDIGTDRGKITIVKDAAFVLPASGERYNGNTLWNVAISVRELKFFNDSGSTRASAYKDSIQEAVCFLVREQKAKVTFLSTCQGIGEYWTDDARFAQSLVNELPEEVRESVTVDTQFRQPRAVIEAYGQFDLLIATRMHAAILAINGAVPTIGVAYEFKIEELYKQLKLEPLLVSITNINPEKLIGAIAEYKKDPQKWQAHFRQLATNTKNGAEKALDALPPL
ncbi:MAG: polysaccharide pyruvyl transferase family protein [Saccharospirillum sp.]|nr:polysaccharide pyruvyl transferase family protein [Saccharospirillum sp.]